MEDHFKFRVILSKYYPYHKVYSIYVFDALVGSIIEER